MHFGGRGQRIGYASFKNMSATKRLDSKLDNFLISNSNTPSSPMGKHTLKQKTLREAEKALIEKMKVDC